MSDHYSPCGPLIKHVCWCFGHTGEISEVHALLRVLDLYSIFRTMWVPVRSPPAWIPLCNYELHGSWLRKTFGSLQQLQTGNACSCVFHIFPQSSDYSNKILGLVAAIIRRPASPFADPISSPVQFLSLHNRYLHLIWLKSAITGELMMTLSLFLRHMSQFASPSIICTWSMLLSP